MPNEINDLVDDIFQSRQPPRRPGDRLIW
jgi:hypothetical protein